ncbi:MAG: prefoldin subunit beta [Candidatus Undinarchaeales archaeon]|jgi:prefoldin beta subunit|nr:prefoldin subunit beta [Candidatus Undinarchaeales archaeon]
MTEEISPEMQKQVMEFQEAQQNIRMILGQKYQLELQFKEIEMALAEIEKSESKEIHKAVGQILIKSDKESITKDLNEKKDMIDVRLKSLQTQEKSLSEKLKSLQDRLQGVIPKQPEAKEKSK